MPLSPWLFVPLYTAVCAMLYRWRGGGLIRLKGETDSNAHTQVRRVTYALGTAAPLALVGTPWWQVGVVAALLFVAQLTGNGRPIGACGGWEDKPLEEFAPFDWVLRRFRPRRRWYLVAKTVMGKHRYGCRKGEDIIFETPHKGFFSTMPYGYEPPEGSNFRRGEYTPKGRLQAWGILWFALWGGTLGTALAFIPNGSCLTIFMCLTGTVYSSVLSRTGVNGWGKSELWVGAWHGLLLGLAFAF